MTTELWLARDKDSAFGLFREEPKLDGTRGWWRSPAESTYLSLHLIEMFGLPIIEPGTKKKIRTTVEVL